jgi:hypothetical protein
MHALLLLLNSVSFVAPAESTLVLKRRVIVRRPGVSQSRSTRE